MFPANGFQRAISYCKARWMSFIMRYKVLHNYFPIIFDKSNCKAYFWLVLQHA